MERTSTARFSAAQGSGVAVTVAAGMAVGLSVALGAASGAIALQAESSKSRVGKMECIVFMILFCMK